MGFLDFIKNRGGQGQAVEQQSQQPQAETAKQMYTRQASEERANAKAPDQGMTIEQRSTMADVQRTMQGKGEQPEQIPASTPAPAPAGASNPQPMHQLGVAADKGAPEMSPTSSLASSRAQDADGPAAQAETPAKSQQQTITRPTPSWER